MGQLLTSALGPQTSHLLQSWFLFQEFWSCSQLTHLMLSRQQKVIRALENDQELCWSTSGSFAQLDVSIFWLSSWMEAVSLRPFTGVSTDVWVLAGPLGDITAQVLNCGSDFGAFRCLLKLKWRWWWLTASPQDLWSSASSLWFRVTLDSFIQAASSERNPGGSKRLPFNIQSAEGNQEMEGSWSWNRNTNVSVFDKSADQIWVRIIDWDEDDLWLFCGFRIRQQQNTTWQNWCENPPIVASAAVNFMSSGALKVAPVDSRGHYLYAWGPTNPPSELIHCFTTWML